MALDSEEESYEEIWENSGIPATVWKSNVDFNLWDSETPPNLTNPFREKEATTYFAQSMMEFIWFNMSLDGIRAAFREDFKGWTVAQFNEVNRTFKKRMLTILEQKNVQVPEGTTSEKFASLVATAQPIEMPHNTYQPSPTPTLQLKTGGTPLLTNPPGTTTSPSPNSYQNPNPLCGTPYIQYQNIPPTRIIYNGPVDSRKVSAFVKAWKPARNYTGRPYDILYDKVKHFVSICRRHEIPEDMYHAVFPEILSDRAETYYMNHIGPDKRWDEIYQLLDSYFNTTVNHAEYYSDWTTLSFARLRRESPEAPAKEMLEKMLDKLQLVQRALGEGYQGEIALHTAVTRACTGVAEFEPALLGQRTSCESLFDKLRTALKIAEDRKVSRQFHTETYDQNFVDRRYRSNRTNDKPQFPKRQFQRRDPSYRPRARFGNTRDKKCFICKKEGCWSTNHSREEREKSRRQYLQACETLESQKDFEQFLAGFEGTPPEEEESDDEESGYEGEEEDQGQAAQFLQEKAYIHRTFGENIYQECEEKPAEQFVLENQYTTMYQGELWDTGAAQVSTVGKCQVEAYLRENPCAKISWTPGTAEIRFGGGKVNTSIGTMLMENAIGKVTYHILNTATPFLLSLRDADRLKAYFNNVEDVIVREDGTTIPVIRKWGHPFFNTSRAEAGVYLTEPELRRLHRRFGHPRTERLHKLLKKAGHEDVKEEILQEIQKVCHHCQTHDPAPQRFKFTIKDECEFNYEVVIDIVQLNGRKALHVIDVATSFQAVTFLRSMSANDAWDALCRCWIFVYQGPPDVISHDPGTNFASEEFRNNAKIMGVSCKEMPIEAHWAIGKVERAHRPLERAYDILHQELSHRTDDETILQMAVKALNDTAGPDGLVPTLLVFGAYPRINHDSPPSPEIRERARAVQKAMKMLREIRAQVSVNRALNTRNGPTTNGVLALPLRSEVLVWREGKDKRWEGPYPIIAKDYANVTVEMQSGPKTFRITQVKPYYQDKDREEQGQGEIISHEKDQVLKEPVPIVQKRGRGRPRKNPIPAQGTTLVTQKEVDALALAIQLREEGKITIPGLPFEESDAQEIDGLLVSHVIEVIRFNEKKHGKLRLWKTRLVREIKGKDSIPYEKSRLIVQGHSDEDKKEILTQAPTIQRMSQRLILALGPSLEERIGAKTELRDITQAYTQSTDPLHRTIIAQLPKELKDKYPKGTVLWIKKPLYGLAEAGVHWFKTYNKHHIEALEMQTSTYDPCLLVTKNGQETFGITGMQTDDTLTLATPQFSEKEEVKLKEAGLMAKPKKFLTHDSPIEFNGCRLQLQGKDILIAQKGQAKQLNLIDQEKEDAPQQYVSQRARGAYIASICQPEAAYDLSIAAQVKEPEKRDHDSLNKRIQWQIDNPERGLRYQPLDLDRAKLFIFTDGSFANNKDMSSQLGFLIVLGTEDDRTDKSFQLCGNIVHWSSTKCKRITRSVLASELYGMVNGFDSGIAISTTLTKITNVLGIARIPVVICTDSRSLYDCLVKLGTTSEKRLMIDVMSLREAYERREISEIRWIDGQDNPADALTKKNPNQALTKLVDDGKVIVRIEAFVDRLDKTN